MCDVEKKAYQDYCQSMFQQIATAGGRQELLNKAASFLEETAAQFKIWGIPDVEANCVDFMENCFDGGNFPPAIFPLFFEEWKRQNGRKEELKLMDALCPAIPHAFSTDEYEDLDEDQASIMRLIDSFDESSDTETVAGKQHLDEDDGSHGSDEDLPF